MAEAGRSLTVITHPYLKPFFLETSHKVPMWKSPSLNQEDGIYSCHQRLRTWAEKSVKINLIKLILNFWLSLSHYYSWPKLFGELFTNLLFLYLNDIKTFCSCHFFRPSFSYKSSHVHVKIHNKCMLFSCSSVFFTLVFIPSQGPLEGWGKLFHPLQLRSMSCYITIVREEDIFILLDSCGWSENQTDVG